MTEMTRTIVDARRVASSRIYRKKGAEPDASVRAAIKQWFEQSIAG